MQARNDQLVIAMERVGFTVTTMRIKTPDGRAWFIGIQSGGEGFRLYEGGAMCDAIEHNAVDGDVWDDAGDLIDYLRAVGGR